MAHKKITDERPSPPVLCVPPRGCDRIFTSTLLVAAFTGPKFRQCSPCLPSLMTFSRSAGLRFSALSGCWWALAFGITRGSAVRDDE